jgi:hypothetical protein
MLVTLLIEKRGSAGQYDIKMKFEDLEWCKISSMGQGASFLSSIIEVANKTPLSALILGVCEKVGEIIAVNVSLTDSVILK